MQIQNCLYLKREPYQLIKPAIISVIICIIISRLSQSCCNKFCLCCCSEYRLSSVVPCCAGFPSLLLTNASSIHDSPVQAACPLGMQPIAPCGLRDTSRPPFNHSRSKAISGSMSTRQASRCGRGEKNLKSRNVIWRQC